MDRGHSLASPCIGIQRSHLGRYVCVQDIGLGIEYDGSYYDMKALSLPGHPWWTVVLLVHSQ